MSKSIWTQLVLSLILVIFTIGCSGSSGTTSTATTTTTTTTVSSTPAYDTIDDLPQANGEVVATSTSLMKGAPLYAASTGMPLGSTTADSFTSDSSMAACMGLNPVKESMKAGGQADVILCYMQQIFIAEETAQTGITSPYGGDEVIYDMDFGGENTDAPSKFAVKTTKNEAGLITDVEMKACGTIGSSTVQTMYIHQTIDPDTGEMTMINKDVHRHVGDGGTFAGSSQTTVSGFVNGDGNYEGSKTINVDFTDTFTFGNDTGAVTGNNNFVWQATSGILSGWRDGINSFGGQKFSNTDLYYSKFQLINGNTTDTFSVANLAIGDGATQAHVSGSSADESCTDSFGADFCGWDETFTESWDGDTKAEVASNDFTETVAAATLPEVSTIETITFTGDEVLDCDAAATGGTITITDLFSDPETSFAACEPFGHEYIDCWHSDAGDGYDANGEEAQERQEEEFAGEGEGEGEYTDVSEFSFNLCEDLTGAEAFNQDNMAILCNGCLSDNDFDSGTICDSVGDTCGGNASTLAQCMTLIQAAAEE